MLLSPFGGFGPGAAALRRLAPFNFGAARAFDRVWQRCDRLLRAWSARRLAREMELWPDERLRDIGLSRTDIASAVEGVRRPYRWVPGHEAATLDPARFGH